MWIGIEQTPIVALKYDSDYQESYDREHTNEAIKERGEVFTPTPLVNEILDKMSLESFTDKTKTFLDNSCGNGQFLAAVLERKMANGISHKDALKTIYGVELDFDNTEECRRRLLKGNKTKEFEKIVEHNIICADALDPNDSGWSEVGFYWVGRPKEQLFFDFRLKTKNNF